MATAADLSRVVHDLNGPLTVIRGLCALLERDEPAPERRHRLAQIDGEAMRIARGLRDIAATAGPATAWRPIDVGRLAASVAERYAPVARMRGLRLVARVGPPAPVVGDAGRIERALDNLVRNALRHCAPGGLVRIAAGARAGRVRLTVRDDGPGVAPADRERIFLAGERGSAPRGPGRGLGLAIAREIAEAHGGSLTLDPVGPGACFRLTLPRAGAPAPAAA
ncbi:MAG: sensor histidine kinase [Thermoleophilia bacterium]